MNNDKVFIIKQKWEEMSHYSRVKAVFFDEEKAHAFIDEQKLLKKNEGCYWIISDREIRDYEPCLNEDDIEILKLESVQHFIEHIISQGKLTHSYLETKWGDNEQRRIEIEDDNYEQDIDYNPFG